MSCASCAFEYLGSSKLPVMAAKLCNAFQGDAEQGLGTYLALFGYFSNQVMLGTWMFVLPDT